MGSESIYYTIGFYIICCIIWGFGIPPPIPPIPPKPGGIPPPIPPIPPKPGGIPPIPPKPGGIPPNPGGTPPNPYDPVPALSPAPAATPVADWSVEAVEEVDAPAPLPLTRCTVSPSVILYSSKVYSSFKILPLNINLISSAVIASYFDAHCSLRSFAVAVALISTSNESPELNIFLKYIMRLGLV